jgi:FdhE protein
VPALDLTEAWRDLLGRRAALSASLGVYGRVFGAWAETISPVAALAWSEAECRRCWESGSPLAVARPPDIDAPAAEEWLGLAMEIVAEIHAGARERLGVLAEAWDRGDVTPRSFLPVPGRIGAVEIAGGPDEHVVAFLATAALRPHLQAYLGGSHDHLRAADWDRGVCPFCGAPPGFADVGEDGRRRLACHLCGGAWTFTRLRCPFCGEADTKALGRMDFEAAADQGYFISTCEHCRGYLKELDRRVRWNGGPAIVEDWGSPHFDLACARAGYRRPAAPLILLGRVPTS